MDSDGTIGPAEMRARRRSAGYVGAVSPEILAKAVAAATGRRRRVDLRRVGADPITSGRGMNVDVVVRHHLPGGGSMIRKTMVGAVSPREVEAYRSGLLVPGRWWRPPHVYALEREGDRTWHLFLEHVGTVRRLHARQDIVRAARAVGELNGAYLRDTGLPARHPWLEREIRSQTRFANPRRATRRFRTVVDKPLVRRAKATLTALEQETAAITQAVAPLPRTLCHGDANTANLVIRGEAVVVLDWATCRIDWLGSDLATLLGLSNPVVRTDEALEADCLDAYAAGVAESAGCRPAERDVALGYRARLVAHSFRRLLVCLPPVPRGTKVTARVAPPRSAYRDLLAHTCDEADALLRAIVEA